MKCAKGHNYLFSAWTIAADSIPYQLSHVPVLIDRLELALTITILLTKVENQLFIYITMEGSKVLNVLKSSSIKSWNRTA